MHFKKFMLAFSLCALLLGQFALAGHSIAHADHEFSDTITVCQDGHIGHDDNKDPQKHECPECVLAQSLQAAFYNAPHIIYDALTTEIPPVRHHSGIVLDRPYKANMARAPPVFVA